MYDKGRINENDFDLNNVPEDTNSNGDIVQKRQGISDERCQRAKILSCSFQRQERILLDHG